MPTVGDCVAQTVVKQLIEPALDAVFLAESYGYRHGRSNLDAVGVHATAVLEVRLGSGVRHQGIVRQYRPRALAAGRAETCNVRRGAALHRTMADSADGARGWNVLSEAAVPHKGGVVSPILANLFMHYAFDLWMARVFPDLRWRRYADDGVGTLSE